MRNALGAKFGLELPPTVMFDYPTAATLASYLAAHVPGGTQQLAAADLGDDVPTSSSGDEGGGPDRRGAARRARSRHQRQRQHAASQQRQRAPPADAAAAQAGIAQQLGGLVEAVLGHAAGPDQPLMEAGLDSLGRCCRCSCAPPRCLPHAVRPASIAANSSPHTRTCPFAGAVELRNTLGAKFGVELQPTVIIDYPTIAALAEYLAGATAALGAAPAGHELEGEGSWEAGSTADLCSYSGSELTAAPTSVEPLPVVTVAGVSGVLPGSQSIQEFAEDAPAGARGAGRAA